MDQCDQSTSSDFPNHPNAAGIYGELIPEITPKRPAEARKNYKVQFESIALVWLVLLLFLLAGAMAFVGIIAFMLSVDSPLGGIKIPIKYH